MVFAELALDPLRDIVTRIGPTFEKDIEERQTIVIDYDSYRRRVKGIDSKIHGASSDKIPELEAELNKFKAKELFTKEQYDSITEKLNEDMINTRQFHDEIVDSCLITSVVCQVN